MTKKRQSSSRKQTTKKQEAVAFITVLLVLLLCMGGLFIGDWLGLIKVDWQALLNSEELSNIISEPSPRPVVVTPITGEWYQLYFTTPAYPDEPAARAETIMQGLIGVINKAQRSLDIAIYELNRDEIGDALLAARNRGVAVRLVTDSDSLEEDETLIRLEQQARRSYLMTAALLCITNLWSWTVKLSGLAPGISPPTILTATTIMASTFSRPNWLKIMPPNLKKCSVKRLLGQLRPPERPTPGFNWVTPFLKPALPLKMIVPTN